MLYALGEIIRLKIPHPHRYLGLSLVSLLVLNADKIIRLYGVIGGVKFVTLKTKMLNKYTKKNDKNMFFFNLLDMNVNNYISVVSLQRVFEKYGGCVRFISASNSDSFKNTIFI